MTEIDKQLLIDVKNYLDITWEDKAGENKLSGMIARAMNAIDGKCGTKFDYTEEGTPRSLMFVYVMYERSGGLDAFWTNYKRDIIALQTAEEVKRYAKNKEQGI